MAHLRNETLNEIPNLISLPCLTVGGFLTFFFNNDLNRSKLAKKQLSGSKSQIDSTNSGKKQHGHIHAGTTT